MKPRVFVSRIIPSAGLERIQQACEADIWQDELPPDYDVLLERVRGVDGILSLLTDRIDAALMDAAGPQLKVVSQMAVGYDNIDVAAAQQRGIQVGHTPGVLTEATADLTMALLLAGARRIVEGVEYVHEGKWRTWGPTTLLGADVTGATLGIIGLGRIGKAVAKRAQGFEMRVLAYSPSRTPEEAAGADVKLVSLDELLSASDFVSVHTPLNASTHHLMNEQTLSRMKRTAILINTARGPIVDHEALYEALRDGKIAGVALDVTDPEPLPSGDLLLRLPNVIVVPHIGSASVGTRNKMALMAAENLIAGVKGELLPHRAPGQGQP